MTETWWNKLPKWFGRLSQWWAGALTDGYFLLAFPARLTDWLSPSIFLAGLLCGYFRPDYQGTPAESSIVFYSFFFIGIFSSHLGLFLLFGFAIGDFLTTHFLFTTFDSDWHWKLVVLIIAKLHEYIIFGIGIVQISLSSKQLTALFAQGILPKIKERLKSKFSKWLFLGFISLLNLILAGYITFLWAQCMVLLIRTPYTQIGLIPVSAVKLFQTDWIYLVEIALIATTLRIAGQWCLLLIDSFAQKIEIYEANAQNFIYKSGWLNQLPKWVNAIWSSLFLTFLLWDTVLTQSEKILFFILAAVIYTLGAYIRHVKLLPDWLITTWKIPLVWRFLIAAIVAYGLVQLLMPFLFTHSGGTFWPVLIPTLLSLLIFSLILPADKTVNPKQVSLK